MADAELVIGARNEAKAVLDEIGSQLQALAIPAQEGSLKIDSALSGVMSKLAYGALSITGAFGAAAIAIGGIATGTAVKAIRDEAEALDGLNRELDNYVGKGRISQDAAKAFAKANRENFAISEKQTLSLMTLASSLGVSQDKLDEAALAAIGLSKALGIEVNAALRKVIDGDDRLVSITDSVNSGLREQSKELEGISGMWNKIESTSKKTLELVISLTQPVREALLRLGAAITEYLMKALIGAVSAFQTYRDDMDSANQYLVASWQLAYEKMGGIAGHFFTKQLPAYMKWYVDNATAINNDGVKVVEHQFSKIGAITSEFLKAVKGDKTFNEASADMMKMFAKPLKKEELKAPEMPAFIEREASAKEAELSEKIAKLGGKLGSSFSEKFKKNLAKFNLDVVPQLNQGDLDALRQSADDDKKTGGKKDNNKATEARLLTRGREDQAIDRVAQATKDAADRLKDIDATLKLINAKKEPALKFEVVGK